MIKEWPLIPSVPICHRQHGHAIIKVDRAIQMDEVDTLGNQCS